MTDQQDIVHHLRDVSCDLADAAADEIERLRTALAEADALISAHSDAIRNNPRAAWPPDGSIFKKVIARHAAHAALNPKDSDR